MKMKFFVTALALCTFSFCSAQNADKVVENDYDSMTVKYDSHNKSTLSFSVLDWNEMVGEEDRITSERNAPIEITICIKLASRKRDCRYGIGVKCGLCDKTSNISSLDGQKVSRSYNATYTLNTTTNIVKLTFSEPVDWDWLTTN